MLRLNNTIPFDVDVSNPDSLKEFLIALKLYCEEIADKAKQMQLEIRTTAPSTNDCEEGEDIRYDAGGVRRTYTKISGSIRYHVET